MKSSSWMTGATVPGVLQDTGCPNGEYSTARPCDANAPHVLGEEESRPQLERHPTQQALAASAEPARRANPLVHRSHHRQVAGRSVPRRVGLREHRLVSIACLLQGRREAPHGAQTPPGRGPSIARGHVHHPDRCRPSAQPDDAADVGEPLPEPHGRREVRELPARDLCRGGEQAGRAEQHLVVAANVPGKSLRQVPGALRELGPVLLARDVAPGKPAKGRREDARDEDEPGQTGELTPLELQSPGGHYMLCRDL